jgi:signal transduction histidine kinase
VSAIAASASLRKRCPESTRRHIAREKRPRAHQGCALGLSIASQVIARHGGTIEAAPVEGRGSIVTVQLPLAPVQRQEDAAAAAAQPVSV